MGRRGQRTGDAVAGRGSDLTGTGAVASAHRPPHRRRQRHDPAVLEELAEVIGTDVAANEPGLPERWVTIRREPEGWHVVGPDGVEVLDDLTAAMVLADLLAGEVIPGPRPPRPATHLDEVAQLRVTVTQLGHALAARVTGEQAVGVLAERQRLAPRAAFERLRKAARSRGRRVHELAREVVASATDRAVPLPPELAGRRP